MIHVSRTMSFIFSIGLLLFASCRSSSGSDVDFQQRFQLHPETITGIQEIASWSTEVNAPISLITFDVSRNNIIAVTEARGDVVYIDIENGEVVHKKVTEIPDFRALAIDQRGEKLIGAMLNVSPEQPALQEYFEWTAVYNVADEAMLECLSISCEPVHDSKNRSSDIGAVIDLNGETIATYDEDAYRIIKLSENGYSGFALVNSPDSDYWWHIGKIAIDNSHDRLALIFQEGKIELSEILKPKGGPLNFNNVLNKGVRYELQPVKFASFDPTGKWLAVVRGAQLDVWNVERWKKEITYSAKLERVSSVGFDWSGKLLFVASHNIIQVIDLEENKLILELETPGITTLHVSKDGQRLFWGDKDGVVHAWAIPKPK